MLILVTSFVLFLVSLGVGTVIGYAIGFKNDKSLKQQISNLQVIARSNKKSTQLKELTIVELQQRKDWDLRNRLAQITGQSVTTPDTVDQDINSMERMF